MNNSEPLIIIAMLGFFILLCWGVWKITSWSENKSREYDKENISTFMTNLEKAEGKVFCEYLRVENVADGILHGEQQGWQYSFRKDQLYCFERK